MLPNRTAERNKKVSYRKQIVREHLLEKNGQWRGLDPPGKKIPLV